MVRAATATFDLFTGVWINMPISQVFSGTQVIGTVERDLPTNTTTLSQQTADGIYQAFIDVSTLTATESYRLRIYEMALTAGVQRVIDDITIAGVQSEPIYVTPALLLMHGWTFTLQKLQGTDRSIVWSIRQVS